MTRYLINMLIGIDQLVTTLVGGWPDETLSSYAHRLHKSGKPGGFMRDVINALFWWQEDHCLGAYNDELYRLQQPRELR